MRILSLHPDAFGGRGGIAAYNRDMITAWCSHPRVTAVVGLGLGKAEPCPLPPRLAWRTGSDGRRERFAARSLKAAVADGPFDLVVCAHVNFLPVAVAASRVARAPLLLLVYGVDVWEPHNSRLVRESLRFVDAICSISQITLDKLDRWHPLGELPQWVVPNAVHPEAFGLGERPPALLARYGLEGRTVLLTVARLSSKERYKGIDEVLDALPALAVTHPSLSYLIVGSGDDRERLEHKAARLGVAERVVFAGYAPDGELADHYRLADAFVMPGRGEGFGFVYLEALACGIPVVASKMDGSREAVRGGALGELVDPDDPADVERAILAALARGRGVIPDGLSYFFWERFEERCHAMLDTVVRG